MSEKAPIMPYWSICTICGSSIPDPKGQTTDTSGPWTRTFTICSTCAIEEIGIKLVNDLIVRRIEYDFPYNIRNVEYRFMELMNKAIGYKESHPHIEWEPERRDEDGT